MKELRLIFYPISFPGLYGGHFPPGFNSIDSAVNSNFMYSNWTGIEPLLTQSLISEAVTSELLSGFTGLSSTVPKLRLR